MQRREFLKRMGEGIIALTLPLGVSAARSVRQSDSRPNFVFVYTDDQRFDAMGCAGNALIHTPHLDSLAARGIRFANAFVTLSICSPSRAASLTGRYGSANGVTTLDQRLYPSERTFAHCLRSAGYRTAHFGKWHLGNSPADLGFDESEYFVSNGSYYNRSITNRRGHKATAPDYIDEYMARQSIRFIEEAHAASQPFVLWYCTQAPHMDHTFNWPARADTLARYAVEEMPVPATWQDGCRGKPTYLKTARSYTRAQETYGYGRKTDLQRHIQHYYAAITDLDHAIGLLWQRCEELGLHANTWFILMGDNGWFLGEHGLTSKVLPYEESMRVPLIIAGPDTAARVDDHFLLNIDLMPTMLELARVERPGNLQGRSLVPLLRNSSAPGRDHVYYEAPTPTLDCRPVFAVRTHDWKYIRTNEIANSAQAPFEELYDMRQDKAETANLAGNPRFEAALKEMRSLLEAARRSL